MRTQDRIETVEIMLHHALLPTKEPSMVANILISKLIPVYVRNNLNRFMIIVIRRRVFIKIAFATFVLLNACDFFPNIDAKRAGLVYVTLYMVRNRRVHRTV